jgi:hypothetical protein
MDAKRSPLSVRRRRPWAVRPWTLAVFGLLLLAGTLIQACSDNNGSTGPTFECREAKAGASKKALAACTGSPAPTTGFANTSAEIKVVVGINPNAITPGTRAGVTAFVTNLNGQPLSGKMVQFSTDVGSLDKTVVVTNGAGQASTYLRVTATDITNSQGKTSATVTAFVDGASGTGIVNFGSPSTLSINPATVTQTIVNPAGCTLSAAFSVSGGAPPYTFTAALGTVTGTGNYTSPAIPVGQVFNDTVTVTDSAGATASASIAVTCNAS